LSVQIAEAAERVRRLVNISRLGLRFTCHAARKLILLNRNEWNSGRSTPVLSNEQGEDSG